MDVPRKSRKLHLILLITAVALLFVIAVLFITLVTIRNSQSAPDSSDSSDSKFQPKKVALCLTPSCVRTAAIFLESMDRSADPCNDFYQYACGNYERKAMIPEDRLSKRRTDEIEDYVKTAIKTILEEPNSDSKMSALRKAKDLYTACMNMTRINEQGPKPMDDLLLLLGEWIGLANTSWVEHQFNWDDFMITLNNNGLENNFILSVELDIEKLNSSSITIEVSLPRLVIPAEDADRAGYLELMKSFAENMGVPRNYSKGQFEGVLAFESQLAQLSLEDNGSRREMSIAEIEKRFPTVKDINNKTS